MLKRYNSLGIKSRTVIPIVIAMVLGISLVLYLILSSFRGVSYDLTRNEMKEMGHHYSYFLKADIDKKITQLKDLKHMLKEFVELGILDRNTVINYIKAAVQEDDSIFAIYSCWESNKFDGRDSEFVNTNLHDETGRFLPYIYREGNNIIVEALTDYNPEDYDRGEYEQLKLGKTQIIEPYGYEINGQNILVVSIEEPIFIDDKFVGLIGMDIKLDTVNSVLSQINIFDSGYIFCFSKEGTIISTNNKKLIGKSTYDYYSSEDSNFFKNCITTGEPFEYISKDEYGKDIMTSIVPVPIGSTGLNWLIGVAAPVNEVLAEANKGITMGIVLGVVVCILAIILLLLVINNIVKKLFSINENLSQSSSFVSSASTQLASMSQELADGSNEQAASIEETLATMEETASMIIQNAENTKIASNLSVDAKEVSAIGAEKMKEMVESMHELKESSNQISNIIKTVNDIAFQTNILALNAEIEAASAGDKGLGFSVVAEEVRNLAQKSAEAAKNTAEMIERNIQLSEQGAKISEDVQNFLDEISAKVEKVTNLVAEISAASDEQSKGTTQINGALGNMEQVVQKNAAASEENATAAEELQAQAIKLGDVVKDLNIIIKGDRKADSIVKDKKENVTSQEEVIPLEKDDDNLN